MDFLEKRSFAEAYEKALIGLRVGEMSLPMDIAYGLFPEEMLAVCRQELADALEGNSSYAMEKAAENAEYFTKYCGVTFNGTQKAKRKAAQIIYEYKADEPRVGMAVYEAKDTKLGAPTKVEENTRYYTNVTITSGKMHWMKEGVCIFYVEYVDGTVTEVRDYRKSRSKNNTYRKSGRSSGSSIDADDYDIGAYYDDNRDEYNDYDEAYEGFLDDADAWDDY